MSPLHVRSKVCMATFDVRRKVCQFAPHIKGSHADFAPHMEWRHSFGERKLQTLQFLQIFKKNFSPVHLQFTAYTTHYPVHKNSLQSSLEIRNKRVDFTWGREEGAGGGGRAWIVIKEWQCPERPCVVCRVQCAVYTVNCTEYCIQYTVCIVMCTVSVYLAKCTGYILNDAQYCVQCEGKRI